MSENIQPKSNHKKDHLSIIHPTILYQNLCSQINTSSKKIWNGACPHHAHICVYIAAQVKYPKLNQNENKIEKLEERWRKEVKKNIFIFIYNLCANFTSPVSVIFERFIWVLHNKNAFLIHYSRSFIRNESGRTAGVL